jgi:hypothetical protein
VMFLPTHPGAARGLLTLQGTGSPLTARLRPVAFALPAVTRLTTSPRHGCAVTLGSRMSATVSQAATVHWTLRRAAAGSHAACPRRGASAARVVASGAARAGRHSGPHVARWSLPARAIATGPARYVLTVFAVNDHGTGRARAMALRVGY